MNKSRISPQQANKSPKIYLILIVALAVGLGISLYTLKQEQHKNTELTEQLATISNPQGSVDDEAMTTEEIVDADKVNQKADGTTSENNAEGQEIDKNSLLGKIVTTLQNYYAASSPGEKLKYVVNPDLIMPLMQDHYFRKPIMVKKVVSLSQPQAFAFQGLSFWRVQVEFSDGGKGFAAVRLIDGDAKIDWESEVKYSTMDWDKWIESADDEGVFRVYAILDQYYPAPFSEVGRYVCLKVTHPDSFLTTFAYIDTRDANMASLIQAVSKGQMGEYTLRLKRVASETPVPLSQVVEMVSPSWIVVDSSDKPQID